MYDHGTCSDDGPVSLAQTSFTDSDLADISGQTSSSKVIDSKGTFGVGPEFEKALA